MDLVQFSPKFFDVKRNGNFITIGNLGSSPTEDSLCFLEDKVYIPRLCQRKSIKCVICTPELANDNDIIQTNLGIAVSDSPRRACYELHNWLVDNDKNYGSYDFPTMIGENCNIHKTAIISKTGVIIGNNVTIEEQVIVKSGVIIEDNVIIFAGAIVGGENQVITKDKDGNLFLVRQVGRAHICKWAAIGYHTMIARGTFPYDETRIGEYTKVENDVEISHNSKVGKNVIVTGQTHICGNTTVGDNSILKPRSIISNRRTIGNNVKVEIGSVVVNDLKDNSEVTGNFAIDHMKFLLWHKKKLSVKQENKQ